MKIIDLEQGTQEWLDFRENKFSASVTPCLFGVGNSSVAAEAYIRWGGGTRKNAKSENFERGHKEEKETRDFINAKQGRNFQPLVCIYDEDERFIASLDGYDNEEVLEVKSSPEQLRKYRETKIVPLHYMYQIQHQLMVTKAKKCLLAIVNSTYDMEIITIEPDLAMQEDIRKKWIEFEAAYKNKSTDYIALMKVEELHKINKQIEALKEQKEEIENYFKEREKDEIFEINNIRLTCYTRSHTHIDYKKIVERNNYEILKSDRQTKQTKTIKITEKKEIA